MPFLLALAALPALTHADPVPGPNPAAVLASARAATHAEALDRIAGFTTTGAAHYAGLTGTWRETVDRQHGRFANATAFLHLVGGNVYDGRSHWRIDRSGGVHRLDAAFSRRDAITDAWMLSFGYLKPQAGGAALSGGERRTRDGRAYDVVTATPAGGNPVELWFDAATHLLAIDIRREPLESVEEKIDDYRPALGAILPYHRAAPGTDVDDIAIGRYAAAGPAQLRFAAPAMPRDTMLAAPTMVPINNQTYVEISAMLNGKGPYDFILDTGGHNIITPEVAKELGLQFAGQGQSGGAGAGTLATSHTTIDELRVGAASMRDQHFYVIPLQYSTVERGARPKLAGILGLELFERLIATIDYRAKTLTLAPATAVMRCAGTSLPIAFNDDMPLVDGAIDGKPGLISIDSGNAGSTVVQGVWADRVGLVGQLKSGIRSVSFGSGGSSTNWITRGGAVTLGRLTTTGATLRLSQDKAGSMSSITEAANAGKEVLSNYRVTFDYPHERMCLVAVPGYQPPPLNRAGLIVSKTDLATMQVVSVIEGTPAAAAAIVAGDKVEAVDGRAVETLSGADAAAIFKRVPGTAVRVTLSHAGARVEKTITLREPG